MTYQPLPVPASALSATPPRPVCRCDTCQHVEPGASSPTWCRLWRADTIPSGFCHRHLLAKS
jgi:hypothetical protein